jgi:transcriptional regulator with XRE-family HTH domain
MGKEVKPPVLSDTLRTKLAEAGISVHALEKQAGLKRSAVQNIIHGKSKKPSADILFAITKVLGCSIQELIGQPQSSKILPSHPQPASTQTNESSFDPDLYAKACVAAAAIFKSHNHQPNYHSAIDYIREIYQYSLNSQKQDIDNFFAEWLFDKFFINK